MDLEIQHRCSTHWLDELLTVGRSSAGKVSLCQSNAPFKAQLETSAPIIADCMSVIHCVRPQVGMVTKPSTEQTQDFSIHNEDFPALPGPNYKDATLTNNEESKAVSEGQRRRARGACRPAGYQELLTRRGFFSLPRRT